MTRKATTKTEPNGDETAKADSDAEISAAEIAELRSLFKSTKTAHDTTRALQSDYEAKRREVLSQLEEASHSNADTVGEHIQIIRGEKGRLSANAKSHYEAIAGGVSAFAAQVNKKQDEVKEQAKALLALALNVGERRSAKLLAAYDAALRAVFTALRPFCANDEEAESIARATSGVFVIYERASDWRRSGMNVVDRALGTASALLSELEQPIPDFS